MQFMLMGSADQEQEEMKKGNLELEATQKLNDSEASDADPNMIKIPGGLINLGNTCYMNASLQCLRAISELNEALEQYKAPIPRIIGNEVDAVKAVTISIRELFKSLDKSVEGVPPLFVLKFFREAFPQFSQQDQHGVFMQQDAEECWTQLVTCLNEKLPPLNMENEDQSKRYNSFVQQYMTGELISK